MTAPRISIILINWNQWPQTARCLQALLRSEYEPYDVLVVDNGSNSAPNEAWQRYIVPALPAEAGSRPGRVGFLRLEHNLGFTGGVNAAVRHLMPDLPDFVFLLNNDALVETDTFCQCVKVAQEADAAIVGCAIRDPASCQTLFTGGRWPGELFSSRRDVYLDSSGEWGETAWVEGSAMMIRRDVIQKRLQECGYLLDPSLFMYCEDLELCRWASERGFRLVMAYGATVYHAVGGSSGGRENSLMYYYTTRNRILLARRMLPLAWRILFHVWFPQSRVIRVVHRLLQGRTKVARSILSGLWDGYRGVSGKCPFHSEGWETPTKVVS